MSLPILCIESNWNGRQASNRSVSYLLQLIATEYGCPVVHLHANTPEELLHNLRNFNYGFRRGLLYLAFHGKPGHIKLGNQQYVSFEELSEMMNHRFAGWFIHFGSCATLRSDARQFKKDIGASMVSGYNKYVYWIESSAMDVLLFGLMQEMTYPKNIQRKIDTVYSGLASLTGLELEC